MLFLPRTIAQANDEVEAELVRDIHPTIVPDFFTATAYLSFSLVGSLTL